MSTTIGIALPKTSARFSNKIEIALTLLTFTVTAVAMIAMQGAFVLSVAALAPVIGASLLAGAGTYLITSLFHRVIHTNKKTEQRAAEEQHDSGTPEGDSADQSSAPKAAPVAAVVSPVVAGSDTGMPSLAQTPVAAFAPPTSIEAVVPPVAGAYRLVLPPAPVILPTYDAAASVAAVPPVMFAPPAPAEGAVSPVADHEASVAFPVLPPAPVRLPAYDDAVSVAAVPVTFEPPVPASPPHANVPLDAPMSRVPAAKEEAAPDAPVSRVPAVSEETRKKNEFIQKLSGWEVIDDAEFNENLGLLSASEIISLLFLQNEWGRLQVTPQNLQKILNYIKPNQSKFQEELSKQFANQNLLVKAIVFERARQEEPCWVCDSMMRVCKADFLSNPSGKIFAFRTNCPSLLGAIIDACSDEEFDRFKDLTNFTTLSVSSDNYYDKSDYRLAKKESALRYLRNRSCQDVWFFFEKFQGKEAPLSYLMEFIQSNEHEFKDFFTQKCKELSIDSLISAYNKCGTTESWIKQLLVNECKQRCLQSEDQNILNSIKGSSLLKPTIQSMSIEELQQCIKSNKLKDADFALLTYEQYLGVLEGLSSDAIVQRLKSMPPDILTFRRLLAWLCTSNKIDDKTFAEMSQIDFANIYQRCRNVPIYSVQVQGTTQYRAWEDLSAEQQRNEGDRPLQSRVMTLLLHVAKEKFLRENTSLSMRPFSHDIVQTLSVDELLANQNKLLPMHYEKLTKPQFDAWAEKASAETMWTALQSFESTSLHFQRMLAYLHSNKERSQAVAERAGRLSFSQLQQFYQKCSAVKLYHQGEVEFCALQDLSEKTRMTARPNAAVGGFCDSLLSVLRGKFWQLTDRQEIVRFQSSRLFQAVIATAEMGELVAHKSKLLNESRFNDFTDAQFLKWADSTSFEALLGVLQNFDMNGKQFARTLDYLLKNQEKFQAVAKQPLEKLSLAQLNELYKKCAGKGISWLRNALVTFAKQKYLSALSGDSLAFMQTTPMLREIFALCTVQEVVANRQKLTLDSYEYLTYDQFYALMKDANFGNLIPILENFRVGSVCFQRVVALFNEHKELFGNDLDAFLADKSLKELENLYLNCPPIYRRPDRTVAECDLTAEEIETFKAEKEESFVAQHISKIAKEKFLEGRGMMATTTLQAPFFERIVEECTREELEICAPSLRVQLSFAYLKKLKQSVIEKLYVIYEIDDLLALVRTNEEETGQNSLIPGIVNYLETLDRPVVLGACRSLTLDKREMTFTLVNKASEVDVERKIVAKTSKLYQCLIEVSKGSLHDKTWEGGNLFSATFAVCSLNDLQGIEFTWQQLDTLKVANEPLFNEYIKSKSGAELLKMLRHKRLEYETWYDITYFCISDRPYNQGIQAVIQCVEEAIKERGSLEEKDQLKGLFDVIRQQLIVRNFADKTLLQNFWKLWKLAGHEPVESAT